MADIAITRILGDIGPFGMRAWL